MQKKTLEEFYETPLTTVITTDGLFQTRTLKADKSIVVDRSSIADITIPFNDLSTLVSGAFSVGSGKTVHFSPGNLYTDGTEWYFEENQFDYRSYDAKNAVIGGENTTNPSGHRGYFAWPVGAFQDWRAHAIVNGGNQEGLWTTMSSDNWTYLLGRSMNVGVPSVVRCTLELAHGATVYGLVLYPDDYTVSDSTPVAAEAGTVSWMEWLKMEIAGAVFLPAAGYNGYDDGYVSGYGAYWTNTESNSERSYSFDFKSSLSPTLYATRKVSECSVRLVQDGSVLFATASNLSDAIAQFNSYPGPNPVLMITENISSSFTITRADGTIDLGGNTVSRKIFIQNNVLDKALTIRNGTITIYDGFFGDIYRYRILVPRAGRTEVWRNTGECGKI